MTMKHLVKTSLLLLALCLPLSAMASDFIVDGVYFKTDLWDDIAMVCDQGEDGGHYSGNVTIPATVTHDDTTYPVTRINAYAFSNCAELTGVTIPLTEIGPATFEGCTALTRIDIPAKVAKIGIWAFQNCTNLTDVYSHIADPSQVDFGFNSFALEDENYSPRTLHVPAGTINAYKEAGWDSYFGNIVEM